MLRFASLGSGSEGLSAIVITHEHTDYIGSALTLARKFSLPLYMTWGTARAVGADSDEAKVERNVLWGDETVAIGDLSVRRNRASRWPASRYLPSLKAHIGGMHGHLNNEATAEILASLDRSKLRHIVAAHLSQQNSAASCSSCIGRRSVLGANAIDVVVASQDEGFGWLML
ncbi:Metal-dependent hydrolase of the beta-lactamase superfamily I [Candidatus Burkholderia pumila]|uniref:Metal-dependent hydrolase of the beta-lactamase superfamily I n=1 Tax=Candidatus Burkholderia pumila TaxID=1090375 RepID=A0ABR5HNT6_9BURK|nr:Metal-dependent hydrolase of the beta-lactamase superfamily I [Candidatus Burkholderia pumila]